MKLKNILPLIGLSIFIYLIYRIGLNNIKESFFSINLFYIILAILYIPIMTFALTYKWNLILRKQGINLNFFYLFKLYLIGTFYGAITPARAGSLIRASYLKKKTRKPFMEYASSIALERLMDLFSLFILATIGCFLVAKHFPFLLRTIIIAFVIFTTVCIIFLRKRNMEKLFLFMYRFLLPPQIKNKYGDKLKNSFNHFYDKMPKLKYLVSPLLVTLPVWIIVNTNFYIVSKAFSLNLPYLHVITFVAIATVIGTIPITISGLGTREATLIMLFGIFGIPPAHILSLSIMAFLIGNIQAVFGFILSFTEKSIKTKEIFNDDSNSDIED